MIDQAGQTDNADKRNELLRKADGILYDEAPVWFFNYNKAVMAYQPWTHGLQANATELDRTSRGSRTYIVPSDDAKRSSMANDEEGV